MEYKIGDIVRTKKVHPCGSKLWKITRVGCRLIHGTEHGAAQTPSFLPSSISGLLSVSKLIEQPEAIEQSYVGNHLSNSCTEVPIRQEDPGKGTMGWLYFA